MNPNGHIEVTPPISYPKVTVGGVQYELKFTMASGFLLEQWGVKLSVFKDWFEAENAAGRSSNAILRLAASMIGKTNLDGMWVPLACDPMTLAGNMLPGEWPMIVKAFTDAMGKVQPVAENPTPAAEPAKGPIQ